MTLQKNNVFGLLTVLFLLIPSMIAAMSVAAEEAQSEPNSTVKLIMIEEMGCPYCELWIEEVGVIYPKTPEGQFAPLTRFYKEDPRVKHIGRVIYTPTFVVMRDDKEIGRILGYPGEEFFWAWLKDLLIKAGYKPVS